MNHSGVIPAGTVHGSRSKAENHSNESIFFFDTRRPGIRAVRKPDTGDKREKIVAKLPPDNLLDQDAHFFIKIEQVMTPAV